MTITVTELKEARGRALDHANGALDDGPEFEKRWKLYEEAGAKLARAEKMQAEQAALALPHGGGGTTAAELAEFTDFGPVSPHFRGGPMQASTALGGSQLRFDDYLRRARAQRRDFTFDTQKHFRSFGEFLQSVQQHYVTRGARSDSRLVFDGGVDARFNRAATGASEVDPTGGGFLVQVDFATAIFMLAHDMGELVSRVNTIPISANANGIKIPGVDETSRATGSRWGGVASYWEAEGTQPTASKPTFRIVEFDLKKLFSLMYTTNELLQDSTALTAIAGQAFSEEVMFMTEDAIFEGNGAGVPLGILNSPATISVAKETGQATKTIVKENIENMWSRCWSRSRKNAIWAINQDCEPQLGALNQPVGTGGELVYLPPGGLSAAPYATLKGRPVIATEYNSTLGTVGDIALLDLSQYTLVDKGGVQAATSMHVAFLTDEMVFRITYRVDGRPMWAKPLTPFKGSNTLSPFVTLATR